MTATPRPTCSVEVFFARLPPDGLMPAEQRLASALRQAAQAARALGLPQGVTFQDWLSRRLPDQASGISQFLSPVGKAPTQTEWRRSAESTLQGPDEKQTPLVARVPHGRKGIKQDKIPPEDFFESLPPGGFTPAELALHEALLDFLRRRGKEHPGIPPAISEASSYRGDPEVHKCCCALLPAGVKLTDWINRRAAVEMEAAWEDERGCTVLHLVSHEEPESDADVHPSVAPGVCRERDDAGGQQIFATTLPAGPCRAQDDPRGVKRKWDPARHDKNRDKVEAFLESLPAHALLDLEEQLRDAVIQFLNQHPDMPPKVSEANTKKTGDPIIRSLCAQLLPSGVGLKDWINCRIGADVKTYWDEARSSTVIAFADEGVVDNAYLAV